MPREIEKERTMKLSIIKAAYALITGGIPGLIKYALVVFNEQVLSKIPNKEVGLKYMRDAQYAYNLIRDLLKNHYDDISEARRDSLGAILLALEELTNALEDYNVTEMELDSIIKKVSNAIDAWKKAKKK